jgi:PAS domain-containing protein
MAEPDAGRSASSLTVSAAELRRNFGLWQERAFAAPVIVARHGKPRLVLSSAERFFDPAVGHGPPGPGDPLADVFAAIPAHSSEALMILDRDLRILAVNSVFEDMAGRGAARLVGRLWLEQFSEGASAAIAAHLRHVLRTGASVQFESAAALVEGRHYRFTAFPHALGVAALIVNRTAETIMEHELEEYRSLAATFALAPNAGYLKINLRGLVYGASPQVRDITGFNFNAEAHLSFAQIAAPEDGAALLRAADAVLSGGESRRLSVSLLTQDGGQAPVVMSLATLWRDHKPNGAMAFFHVLAA